MAITADEVHWKLSEIRSKVRKLTGRPSVNQISDNEVDKYINRFYTQDLMALLQLDEVQSYWRFETMVNVSDYAFRKQDYALEGPVYINGEPADLSRDPTTFHAKHPMLFSTRESAGTGDGATTTFTGTLSKTTVNAENIIFDDDSEALRVKPRGKITAVSKASPAVVTTEEAHGLTNGDTVKIMDMRAGMTELDNVQTTITSVTTTTFQLDNIDSSSFTTYTSGGTVYPVSVALLEGDQGGSGRVTLSSGAFSITFNTAPADGQALVASYEFSSAARPIAALAYDNQLHFHPVPDGSYQVQVSVRGRPAPLVADSDALASDAWGKLVAYGAAVDLLNDHGQQEGAALIERQFRVQQLLAQRKSLINRSDERSVPRF